MTADRRYSPRFRSGFVSALLGLGLALGLLVGCHDKPAEPSGGAVGDTITVPYIADITGVNELTSQVSSLGFGVLYRGLFLSLASEDPDYETGPPTFQPEIAESWEFSEDRKILTFHLRSDLVWSDGEPLTAADVEFTFRAQTHPDIAWSWADYKRRIARCEVVDPYTVNFHFSEVYALQLHDAVQGVILPEHAWSQLPFDQWGDSGQWFVDNLVVSGPYDVESWQPGQRLVLVQNDRYFGAPEIPKTDRIVFEIIPDQQTQTNMLRSGEVQFVELVAPEDAEGIQKADDTYLLTYIPRFFAFIAWNVENPLFADVQVRQALTSAIDRQAIIDSLYYGFGRVTDTAIPPNVWAHNGDLKPRSYDPDLARKMLADAGWKDSDGDGILDRDGTQFRFELLTNTGSPVRRDILVMVQEQLKRVSIDAQPRTMEFNSMLPLLGDQKFDAAMSVLSLGTDLDLSYYYHSRAIENGFNWGGFSDPEVDALLDEIAAELEPKDNLARLLRIQEVIHEKQPVTYLYHALRLSAARTALRDAKPNALSPFDNIASWRLVDPEAEPLPPQPDPRAGLDQLGN